MSGLLFGGRYQLPPQLRLPGLLLRPDRSALFPIGDPVRPIDQILVEHVGDALAELIALALIRIVGQIAVQRGKVRFIQQLRQDTHQPPEHGRFGIGVALRDLGQHLGKQTPDKRRGQRKLQPGGDAEFDRQLLLEPLRHAGALHQDQFTGEGIG